MDWGEATGDNLGVELHDSQMVAAEFEGGTLTIRLSPAWLHRSTGVPGGQAEGTQWNQDAALRLDDARIVGELPEVPGWVTGGSIATASHTYDNMIPAPIDLAGEVRLTLEFSEGTILRISASRFRVDLEGDPEFIDVWPPA